MSTQQEFQQIAMAFQDLENRRKMLQEQLGFLENNRTGLNMSTQAIEDLEKIDPGEEVEVMLPIGNTAFVKAKIENHHNFIVAIGKDVFVEKNCEQTKQWMKKISNNYETLYEMIANQIRETNAQMEQIRPQMESIYRQMNQIQSP